MTPSGAPLTGRQSRLPRVGVRASAHASFEGALASRSKGTGLGGDPVSTYAEDCIVRNEMLLTLVQQRRDYLLATGMTPHLKARHVEGLDSWEAFIQRSLASAWDLRVRSGSSPKGLHTYTLNMNTIVSATPPIMSRSKQTTVLIVDDHAVVLQSVCSLLETERHIKVIGKARNGRQAVKMARALQPDLILMDISMPVLNGIEATRQILAANPRGQSAHSFYARR